MAVVAEQATATDRQSAPTPSRRRLGIEQAGVAAGQLTAGIGNLVFALIVSRLLAPGEFAHLSVFLSLYLVLSLPAASISAASAMSPDGTRLQREVFKWSSVIGVLIAVTSGLIGPAFHLPALMIAALGLAMPALGPLAGQRGRLYGWSQHQRLVTSLLAEPAVRLTLGVGLAAAAGSVGGAAGVVVAAYAALEVARGSKSWRRWGSVGDGLRHRRRYRTFIDLSGQSPSDQSPSDQPPRRAPDSMAGVGWTAAAFAVLAVLQSQDLIFANRLLGPSQAGAYAALSTLGGAAAFATVTVPLVLLPRAVRGERHALPAALGLTAALGGAAVALGAVAPSEIAAAAFGSRYRDIGGMVVPYLTAMALLGVARVLIAHRTATGKAKAPLALAAVVTVGQAAFILGYGHNVDSIAYTTVGATAALTVGLGLDQVIRLPAIRIRSVELWRSLLEALSRPAVLVVTALTLLVGMPIRFVIFRGIWLDEATSIYQAGLSFGGMIHNLETTDVHPPLYFSILWVTDRILGNGSLAMRVPSILAGTLVIPAAYLAARDLWSRRTGVVAAAIATFGPFLVWYSQEARMYSMFMLWGLLAMWAQTRVLQDPSRRRDWAIFTLASVALVWTEYFGAFQVIAQELIFVAALWTGNPVRSYAGWRAGWVLSLLGFAALIAPLVPFCWHQFMVNQNAGKGFGTPSQVGLTGETSISIYTVLANMAWALVGYHSATIMAALVALWPAGILLSLFLLGRRLSPDTWRVIVVAGIPTLMLLAIGEDKRSLFDIRYISGVVALLPLLAARLVTGATSRLRIQVMACALIAAVLLVSLGDEQVNGSNPRLYDFAGALRLVNADYQPGDLLLYDPGDLDLVIKYYSPQIDAAPLGSVPAVVAPGRELFVLGSQSLMGGNQPGQLGSLLSKLRRQDRPVAKVDKANVTVWIFEVRQ